jgi:hypothetical protein
MQMHASIYAQVSELLLLLLFILVLPSNDIELRRPAARLPESEMGKIEEMLLMSVNWKTEASSKAGNSPGTSQHVCVR